jgi:hypothetical protein
VEEGMTDDLVKRLRAWRLTQDGICPTAIQCDCSAAADRIEALERENNDMPSMIDIHWMIDSARREALEEAARVVDSLTTDDLSDDWLDKRITFAGAMECAIAAIRALKGGRE